MLTNFSSEVGKNKHNILLILGNAPCHKVCPMNNMHNAFLPLDCTGVLQILDVGIIQPFKAHYRKHQVSHFTEIISKDDFSRIFLHDAIYMI